MEFDEIGAAIIFFTTIELVDNAINFVELLGARINELLLQAF
ncbi:MAG: hypothetical protein ACPGQV_17110 [Alphaproteobacteria bacterium]